MIKKILLLLTLPTIVCIYLESCNKPCEHQETSKITGISINSGSTIDRNILLLDLEYLTYYAQNFQFNLTNKSYAQFQDESPCINQLINPIDSISIVSKNDFSSSHLANSELNSLFVMINSIAVRLNNFTYNFNYENPYNHNQTRFLFNNDSLPTLDSIHDINVTVFCNNGEIFQDSIVGINLKSNL